MARAVHQHVRMKQILIVYATSHGHTRLVAQAIADRLRADAVRVRMFDITHDREVPDLATFDAVVVGSRVHFGKLDRHLRAFAHQHRFMLAARPVFLFSVGMAASGPHPVGSDATLSRWSTQLGLTPLASAAFGGALPYRSYGPFMRLFMRIVSGRGGHPTDTSRDYDLTDWAAVSAFADVIAQRLGGVRDTSGVAKVSPTRPPSVSQQ